MYHEIRQVKRHLRYKENELDICLGVDAFVAGHGAGVLGVLTGEGGVAVGGV